MAEAKKETKKTKKEEVAETPKVEVTEVKETKKTAAKAGKRSEKALKEAEEKQAKEERKAESTKGDEQKPKAKQAQKVRTKLERKGKKFRKAAEAINPNKNYSLKDALELAAKTSPVKFDATVELHIRLGVDPKQADQNLRDTVVLPAGTGKAVRIAAFVDTEGVAKAKKAGADIAGAEEFLQKLDKGTLDFDILITTPQQMPKLGKYARLLGPKGLMPNPKSGTVTTDIEKAVSEAKAGRVEYRVDSTGIVHVGIGKVSFGGEKLLQNARVVLASIKTNRPASLKGNYVKSLYATTSMGPSIPIENSEV